MAQTGSADPVASALWQWGVIGASLLAAWSWVLLMVYFAPDLIGDEPGSTITIGFTLLVYVPLLPIAVIAGMLARHKVLRGGQARPSWTAIGIAIGAGGLTATLALSWLNGGLVAGAGITGFTVLVLVAIAVTIVQSAMEEVLFRGWLQPALSAQTGPVAGVAVATVLFTAFHLIGGPRQLLSLLVIALAGLLFGLLALRSGGLWAPVAAHAAWNGTENSVFGLLPNPGNPSLGSLVDFDMIGSPLWGGSEEGLNASVGTAMVLLALIVPLLVPRATLRAAAPAPGA
ncbi:CPBP family intramembrane glutamic endopeptidase [Novosphingobium sp. AAP83]|uniref:CPBP family intramembrane glutamic endopeptidase n=1 Tax=Novosphingobium sp. AAP83 TaxID=1523425 RepID=UPI0006B9F917|nr:type II CAAX endopeptidase family protein [Novosphingobium sp. AAP83]